MAVTALGAATPATQAIAAALGGTVAMTTHLTKAGTRAVANTSPEPFTNWGLSLAEDVFVMGLTWFALQHPFAASIVAVVLLVAIVAAGVRSREGRTSPICPPGRIGNGPTSPYPPPAPTSQPYLPYERPVEPRLHDLWRNSMAPVVLAIGDVVAEALQPRDEAPAGVVDRHHVVVRAVRDEDARLATGIHRRHDPRREGEDLREQVACADAERQRVRRAVRVPGHRQPRAVYRAASQRLAQRGGQEVCVGTVGAKHQIPRCAGRGSPARG